MMTKRLLQIFSIHSPWENWASPSKQRSIQNASTASQNLFARHPAQVVCIETSRSLVDLLSSSPGASSSSKLCEIWWTKEFELQSSYTPSSRNPKIASSTIASRISVAKPMQALDLLLFLLEKSSQTAV